MLAKFMNKVYKTICKTEKRSETAMFWKFEKYRTWSYWTYLLYCEEVKDYRESGNTRTTTATDGIQTVWKSTAWSFCDFAKIKNLRVLTKKRWRNTSDKYLQKQLTFEIFKFAAKEYKKKKDGHHSWLDDSKASMKESFKGLNTETGSGRALTDQEFQNELRTWEEKVKEEEDNLRDECRKNYKSFDEYKNYDTFTIVPAIESFKSEVFQTFVFINMWESWGHLFKRNNYGKMLQVTLDWIIRWFVWSLTLIFFPLVVCWVLYYIPSHCMEAEFEKISGLIDGLVDSGSDHLNEHMG